MSAWAVTEAIIAAKPLDCLGIFMQLPPPLSLRFFIVELVIAVQGSKGTIGAEEAEPTKSSHEGMY